jgi:hypothetical protein
MYIAIKYSIFYITIFCLVHNNIDVSFTLKYSIMYRTILDHVHYNIVLCTLLYIIHAQYNILYISGTYSILYITIFYLVHYNILSCILHYFILYITIFSWSCTLHYSTLKIVRQSQSDYNLHKGILAKNTQLKIQCIRYQKKNCH